jgi:hypothetical protein
LDAAAVVSPDDAGAVRVAVSHNAPPGGAGAPRAIEDSLAYNNGTLSNGGQAGNGDRNGYKFGGEDIKVNHIVRRSIAFRNGKHGFTYNSNPGAMTISGNISIDNTERNVNFDAGTSVFRNNVSCRSGSGTNDRVIGDASSGQAPTDPGAPR